MGEHMKKTGLIGAFLVALCCVTPLLPMVLAAAGLGSFTAYVYTDAVLFPVLGFFILLALLGTRRQKNDKT
jgi:mercuric ion transport protein